MCGFIIVVMIVENADEMKLACIPIADGLLTLISWKPSQYFTAIGEHLERRG